MGGLVGEGRADPDYLEEGPKEVYVGLYSSAAKIVAKTKSNLLSPSPHYIFQYLKPMRNFPAVLLAHFKTER